MNICIPLNLYDNEIIQCGCGHKIAHDETAFIIKNVDPENKNLKQGDSGLVFCGTCFTEKFPEFKSIK